MPKGREAMPMSCSLSPTIAVIAYNRPASLERLLRSLAAASVPDSSKAHLVISIDGGGDAQTVEVARGFLWTHGDKLVIEHEQNLGLKEHVLQCGDLSQQYGSIILLEDDLVVSPAFYRFSCQALTYYAPDSRIAGISLYSQRLNETARCLFEPIHNGCSVFLSRMPSSWGQAFTSTQWRLFRDWLKGRGGIADSPDIPEEIQHWPESSWKKWFCSYMVDADKWFVYPYISYTTNFGEVGRHHVRRSTITQVELATNSTSVAFPRIEQAIKYDLYWELVSDPCAGGEESVLWDIHGTKPCLDADYVVSSRAQKGYRRTRGFALDLRPVQLNYFMDNEGTDFWLYERIREDGILGSPARTSGNGAKFRRRLGASRCEWMSTRDILVVLLSRVKAWVKNRLRMPT